MKKKVVFCTLCSSKKNPSVEVLCRQHAGHHRSLSIPLIDVSIWLAAEIQLKSYIKSTMCWQTGIEESSLELLIVIGDTHGELDPLDGRLRGDIHLPSKCFLLQVARTVQTGQIAYGRGNQRAAHLSWVTSSWKFSYFRKICVGSC